MESERIRTLFNEAAFPDGEVAFRRALLEKANAFPLCLQYGLGMKAEYPVARELLEEKRNVRHDVRLMGSAALHPLAKNEELRTEIFGILERESTNCYDALIGAMWKENVVVEITGEGALHLSSTYFGVHDELIIVHVHKGAKGVVTEELKGEENRVAARTIIAVVEEGGSLEVRTNVTTSIKGSVFLRQFGAVRKDAKLTWFDVSNSPAHVYTRTMSDLQGAHAISSIYMTAVSDGDRILDVEHRMVHSASQTHSRIATAGVGRGNSRTIYRGDIMVKKGTEGTDGRQEGRFLVLEKTAKIDAVPALDIEAHDVRSAHALSVGYLSPTMLFYPRLRGLHAEDAVGFLVSGMMKKTLSRGGASERDAYEMSRIGEAMDRTRTDI
jgi:Fe-S cluster assembly protein SufB